MNIISLLLFANDSIVYNYSFGNYKIDKIKVGEVYLNTIHIEGVENSSEYGLPELPVKYINLLLVSLLLFLILHGSGLTQYATF